MTKIKEGANLEILKRNCPKCGNPMKIRIAKQGYFRGSHFWGCSRYPRCQEIVKLTQQEIDKINSTVENKKFQQDNSVKLQEEFEKIEESQYELNSNFQAETPILTKPFVSKSIIEGYEAHFFQTLALPYKIMKHIDYKRINYDDVLFYSRFRVDYVSKGYYLDEDNRAIFSLCLRLLSRGKITLASSYIEESLKKHFGINLEDSYDLSKLNNFINYNDVVNNVDSDNEKLFINKCLKDIFGTTWASQVMTQVSLDSLIESNEMSGQRVDFLISQLNNHCVLELDGEEHKLHKDNDSNRDSLLRKSGYNVLRINNKDLLNFDINIQKLKEYGFYRTSKVDFNAYERFIVSIKILHQLQIAIVKGLEQGYIRLNENLSISIDSDLFDQNDLDYILKVCLNDLNSLVNNFSELYGINLNLNLKIKRENDICITFGNVVLDGRQIIIRDINIKDNIVTSIEQFDHIRPIYCDKKILKYFLNYIFRFKNFQEGQYESIERLISRNDSIILLPTGSGKSLIYQLTSLIISGMTIVISPLTSLMDDQIENLIYHGIDNALKIYSSSEKTLLDNTYDLMKYNNYSLLYLSPERLQISKFRNLIADLLIGNSIYTVAIDEAHCVSEWGHDFRTAYLNIGRNSRTFFKKNEIVPVLVALTGTASTAVLKDVQRELQITDIDAIITPKTFDRNELRFRILKTSSASKNKVLIDLLNNKLPDAFQSRKEDFQDLNEDKTHCGLIFCPNVNGDYGVSNIANQASSATGLKVGLYSGKSPKGFSSTQKWNKLKTEYAYKFKHNELNLLVATKAFGMGIDKPNIRYTIHYGIPGSIESFYQEAGRAGRDRNFSECLIIFSNDNLNINEKLLNAGTSLNEIRAAFSSISYDQNDDISRMLFFHVNSFKGIEEENKLINKIIDLIFSTEDIRVYVKSTGDRNDLEKAIQRLVVLGVIGDYSVDYSSDEYCIEKNDIDKTTIINNYCTYVKGYNEGRVLIEKSKFNNIMEITYVDFVKNAVKILIEFIYDTIEKGRRRALKEVYEMSKDAVGLQNQDRIIRNRIIKYFDSSYSAQLEEIIGKREVNFSDIITAFDGNIIEGEQVGGIRSKNEIENMRGQVGRYLESTPDHPSLLFIRSLSESYVDNFNERIIIEDYENAIVFANTRYEVDNSSLNNFIVYYLHKIYQNRKDLYNSILLKTFKLIKDKTYLIEKLISSDFVENDMINLPLLIYCNSMTTEVLRKVNNESE